MRINRIYRVRTLVSNFNFLAQVFLFIVFTRPLQFDTVLHSLCYKMRAAIPMPSIVLVFVFFSWPWPLNGWIWSKIRKCFHFMETIENRSNYDSHLKCTFLCGLFKIINWKDPIKLLLYLNPFSAINRHIH